MRYKNLILIGTSHIAKQSLEEVERVVKDKKPDIIALELDKKRFYALTQKKTRKIGLKDIKRIGLKGFIFNMIGAWVERKLGKYVGVKPGSEMLKAIELAKKNKSKIALIDQDIEITLQRLSNAITWREKWHFIVDILKGVFLRKSELKKLGIERLDLTKVPSKKLIKRLTNEVKKRYPGVYRVLVEERNEVMGTNLSRLMDENPEKLILGVIGAGHEDEMLKLIKKPDVSYSFKIKDLNKAL
ncbi:TraB/GumN family protein [Candidatus Woesearchaeota archaeon]|nr:TraB/GumN family protein [Candidatus Woesearchaeota archaeon]